jgi:hypothetical protein
VLQRLAVAASNIGATMIVVDNDGRPQWSSPRLSLDTSKPLPPSEIDFLISLHFESPRLIDAYSYYALWQPLDFYFHFGYEQSLRKMLSHNDCLSCLSDFADAHGRNAFGARGPINPDPFPTLFHNVPQPYLEPRIDGRSRLFYIGINWEKGGRSKGRHSGLFDLLDGDEILDIYGPRKLLNFEPWEGFKSYRGELPFDGLSTVTAINKAGICLALSSEPHKRAGLMSNRLFEGLAAGAAVIVDSNRFAQKHFSDVAYFIDDRGSAEDVAFQVRTIVEEIRRGPEKAIARVRKGQARLAESFSLEGSLRGLISGHAKRVEYYRSANLAEGSVSVILTYQDGALEPLMEMIANVAGQISVQIDLVLVCDATFLQRHRQAILSAATGAIRTVVPRPLDLARTERVAGQPPLQVVPTGPKVAEALADLATDYFCFLRQDESWFHDHLASLLGALRRHAGTVMAASGVIEQSTDAAKTSRGIGDLRLTPDDGKLLQAKAADDFGRFLFHRSVIDRLPMDCLGLLDGQEPNLVRLIAALHGDPAQSGYATYVRDLAKAEALPESMVAQDHQRQFIRDTVAFDSRWLARMAVAQEAGPSSAVVPPMPFERYQPLGVTRHLPLDRLVETGAGGGGVKYLEQGFSAPEKEGVWIDGDLGVVEFHSAEPTWAPDLDLDLVVYMNGRAAHDTGRPQHCTVVMNGVAVAYVETPAFNARYAFRVPRNAFPTDGRMRLQLIPDHAEFVYDDSGRVIDPRRLGIHLQRFGLVSRPAAPRPALAVEAAHAFTDGSPALGALRDGFVYSDSTGTVLLGRGAHLSFEATGFSDPMHLQLWLSDRSTGTDAAVEYVLVTVNGVPHGAFEVTPAETRVDVALRPEAVGPDAVCAVTLEFGPPGDGPAAGEIPAIQLHRLQVVDTRPPPPPPPPLMVRVKRRLRRVLQAALGRI